MGVTTTNNHPLNGCCSNSILTQVRAKWSYHIIYGQLAPSSALWPPGHLTCSLAKYVPRPYPAFISLIGQFFTSPAPRPLSLFLVVGGHFSLPGAYGPSSHHQGPWRNPLYWWGFGLNGPKRPFRPPMASAAHGTLRRLLAQFQ
ncbi:hypothetical protein O181_100436 [Austropuccinia psidii MF-1]|uniref:Uncharacterized protein n=1 Tax=Austropuccinia psidii MF-1 TaxID=1389203 RepID=A0A9Q3PHT0_9BASI|nr:hypothetical protein [Austropuccinia psidii MF-1]